MTLEMDYIEQDGDELGLVSFKYKGEQYRLLLSLENKPDENKIVFILDKTLDEESGEYGTQTTEH